MIETLKTFPPSIQNVIELIIERSNPTQVILFGSRAREIHRENSDFDICVTGKTCNEKTWTQLLVEIEDEPLTLHKIDVVEFESLGEKYQEQIRKEGKIIYDRDDQL